MPKQQVSRLDTRPRKNFPLAVLVATLAVLAAALLMIAGPPAADTASHVLPHLLLTLTNVFVSALIFAYGWNARGSDAPPETRWIAIVFAAIGILTFSRLPPLLGASGTTVLTGPSTYSGLAAQTMFSLALLIPALPRLPRLSGPGQYGVLAALLAAALALGWAAPNTDPDFLFAAGAETKMRYFIVALNLVAVAALWRRQRQAIHGFHRLIAAAGIAALGQLLAASSTVFSQLAGHAYLLLAALLVCHYTYFRAIGEPYRRLEETRRKLELSRERFRSMTELSSDWYWEQDSQFRFTETTRLDTDASLFLWGKTAYGKTRWELPIIETHPGQMEAHRLDLEAHRPFSDLELARAEPNGGLQFIRISGQPFFSADGSFAGYRGVSKDITTKKRAELLRTTENRLLEMLSTEQPLEAVLEAACRESEQALHGSTAAILRVEDGQRLKIIAAPNLAESFRRQLNGIVVAPDSSPYGRAAYTGKMVVADDIADNPLWSQEREAFAQAGFSAVVASPVTSRETVQGVLALHFSRPLCLDAGDRQCLGRIAQLVALAIEHARNWEFGHLALNILKNAREGVLISDTQGKIVLVNAAYTRITGYTADALVGKPFPTASTLQGESFYLKLKEALMQAGHWSGELWERHKDGHLYFKWLSVTAIRNAEGRITHNCTQITEMTRQKQAELQLRLRHEVTEALAGARGTEQAIGQALSQICKFHDWDFGACWHPDDSGQALECVASWAHAQRNLEKFCRQIGESRLILDAAALTPQVSGTARLADLARNSGYPGKADGAAGLGEVLTVPVIIEGDLVAVLEFRNQLPRTLDPQTIDMICSLGNQIGTFLVKRRAEAGILVLNKNLENQVQERTRGLEAVVRELEAFSYSVSHDLRAPLRSIDGFARLVEQKHAGGIDETGRDYLARIRHNSLRMGELIDDMLLLSQVSRGEFAAVAQVNLSKMVRAILDDYRAAAPERRATTEIEDGLLVQGDPRLLRIALENLLGNAWKFTSRREDALIAVGTAATPHGQAVFIRDNGAGFDMRYAHKMFESFQRLHSSTEFEGTGIGLAIVQRIINRHGGRIWAEGTVGAGATVYFIIQGT